MIDECHHALTKFIVKGLHPFSTVEEPAFREMTKKLCPRYNLPSRDTLSNQLIPAWYNVEKENLLEDLKDVKKAAITADGWTSLNQDHYLTVTLHYIKDGVVKGKVLQTKAVYQAQTGAAVAEEIGNILDHFKVRDKVVAATVDNAGNMDVALKRLNVQKIGCFAHTLNLAAQKIQKCQTVSNWVARVRAVVVWMKSSHMAKVVLREKQKLLNKPQHMLLLDVRTQWNSLYLMVERFSEQFPAIQAASMDPRLKKLSGKEKVVEKLDGEDFRKAEEFVKLMRVLYTSTLCVSTDTNPTCGQILPILEKLEGTFMVQGEDSPFSRNIKEKIWTDLSTRYQDAEVLTFLEEATATDPRFKLKKDTDDIWDRLKAVAVNSPVEQEV
ncbi:zinc finger BED domain-containing protein 1-like [Thalassophryne amazonica]|uniref:zinc finger BED domain-containing protein 1-like n=1 Tax=Thalassophryne amazonica TaxID=390379 RepID=UPI0014708BF3|nr:zinc finger BED domain-containing protein 1-like [Thalassophryne amazonica]